jgi:hypothetical protein
MGFLDKAKQMAEQAQKKLDEVQQDFNKSQAQQHQERSGPATEYDKHGRPVQPAEPEAPVAPPAGDAAPPEAAAPAAAAPPPPAEAAAPPPSPAPPPAPQEQGDEGDDPNAPPKMTSGDPLAG